MLIHTISSLDKREIADALVLGFYTDQYQIDGLGRLQDICSKPVFAGDFTAKEGQIVSIWNGEPEEKRIFLLGLGRYETCSPETIRFAYGAIAKACLKHKCTSLNILVPAHEVLPHESCLKALLEGLFLAGYAFDKLKSQQEMLLDQVTLIGPELHLMAKVAERTKKVMSALWQARDLINGNADDITPQYLAQYAKEMSQEFPRITTEVKDKAWIEKEGMGLLLAVARGSACDPSFIVCSYQGNPVSSDHTVIVGKGITYDTGGLKLKSIEGMLSMRCDMAGAAVCLATVQALAALGVAVNVTSVIPASENAISALSYKLGDVYKSRAGISVEVTNTDAEGRLVLADAISWVVDELKPNRIIDVGTLTGSIEVALGSELMGLFSNSDSLAEELLQSGHRTHELAWRMPLYQEYKEQLKSDVADIKNAATPKGGAIICALFIEQFVKNVPWAHIDMASVAFAKEARKYWPKNATGIGVRLLVDYFEQRDKNDNSR